MPTCTAPRLPPPASTNAVEFFPCCGMALTRSRAARPHYSGLGDLSDNRVLRARRQCRSEVAETCLDMRTVAEGLVAGVSAATERDSWTARGANKAVVTDERERPFDDAGSVCRRHDAQETAFGVAGIRRYGE